MGMPREAVVDMLLPVFLPVNAIKGALNAAITLLLYKPLTRALRSAHLLPAASDTSGSSRKSTGIAVLCACVILLVSIIVLLILNRA